MNKIITVIAVLAVWLSAAALTMSLTHAGPAGPAGMRGAQGPPGPQGNAGRAAQTARLGVCFWADYQSSGGVTWVDGITLAPASLVNGVYTCTQGQFVSIVPQPSSTG